MVTNGLIALYNIAIILALQRDNGEENNSKHNLPPLPQQQVQFVKCLYAAEGLQSLFIFT